MLANLKRPQRRPSPPWVFKLGRSEVAQRGVDALVGIDLIEKSSPMRPNVSEPEATTRTPIRRTNEIISRLHCDDRNRSVHCAPRLLLPSRPAA